jgi:methylase of polypeptide subunit release factors
MMTVLLDGKLFLAPIGSNPQADHPVTTVYDILTILQSVIDIGTGTGIWAMQVFE